jgi:MFS family permease
MAPSSGQGRGSIRRLAVARGISGGGSQAAQIALVYEIYALTRSGAWVVAALFATISVGALVAPMSGWVADRFDRRRVMVCSELMGAAAYFAMVFLHAPWELLLGALGATVLGSPFRAASGAAIPNLVDWRDVPWANAQLATAFNIALVAGPLAGGAIVALAGAGAVFAVNAATFVVSALLIGLTSGRFGSGDRRVERPHAATLVAGFRALTTRRPVLLLAIASALAWSSFGSALVIDPVLARYFHAGSVGYGLLTAVWGGGAVLGALVAGRTVSVASAPKAIVLGMAAMSVSLGSIVVLPTFGLIVAAGAVGGAGSGFVFVPWLVFIQHQTEDSIRGRVLAAADAFDQSAFLVGMGLAVPVLSSVGPHSAYGVAGALLALAAVMAALAAHEASEAANSADVSTDAHAAKEVKFIPGASQ